MPPSIPHGVGLRQPRKVGMRLGMRTDRVPLLVRSPDEVGPKLSVLTDNKKSSLRTLGRQRVERLAGRER